MPHDERDLEARLAGMRLPQIEDDYVVELEPVGKPKTSRWNDVVLLLMAAIVFGAFGWVALAFLNAGHPWMALVVVVFVMGSTSIKTKGN